MKLVSYSYIILICIFLIGCKNEKVDDKRPEDFSFILTGNSYSYNSATCRYSVHYNGKDSTINVCLPDSGMKVIYESFKKYDFMSLPYKFTCAKKSSVSLPAFTTTLEVRYKGIIKKVSTNTYCEKKVESLKEKKFYKLCFKIGDILQRQSQIKNMPDSDFIYM